MESPDGFAVGTAALRTGIFFLTGSNQTNGITSYTGTVDITLREGTFNVYDLMWKIEGAQQQRGVGVLNGGILSVGYYELNGEDVKDIGSVSYLVVDDSHLQGQWASVQGGGSGFEKLSWQLESKKAE
jgi:hypothetical protein